jgi:O-antigen ligase
VLEISVHSRIQFILSCLLAFLLPFKQVVAICIALLLLNYLLEGRFREKMKTMRHTTLFVFFIAFYLLHVLGMCWTRNQASGWFDLEVKLSLLIFPIVFASRPLESEKVDRIFSWFLSGCGAACLLILGRALYYFIFLHENKFFYEEFSYFMHPSYFSMYLNFAMIYIFIALFRAKKTVPKLVLGLLPLFALVIVLLSSKLGMISLVLVLAGALCGIVIRSKKYVLGFLSLGALAASVFAVVRFSPEIRGRVDNAIHALSEKKEDKTNAESTAVRMLIWGVARETISEHPLVGAGTGDAKDVLMERYKSEGILGAYAHQLNAHNEYLQVLVALGLFGFILFLGMLLLPAGIGFREHKAILPAFVGLIALNFFPESMLETQAGVMFYGFFNSLLVFSAAGNYGFANPFKRSSREAIQ